MKAVLIFVDAMRSDYITSDSMPFLWKCANKNVYVKKIVPSFTFCERAEILTGVPTERNGYLTAIGDDPLLSEYQKYKWLFKIFGIKLIPDKYMRYFSETLCSKLKIYPRIYHIPLKDIYRYVLTEDRLQHNCKNALNFESIFDIMNIAKKSVAYELYPTLRESVMYDNPQRIIQQVKLSILGNVDFIPIFLGDLDSKGHLCGNDINKIMPYLQKMDKNISEIISMIKSISNDFEIIILGDHGMVPVKKCVDILAIYYQLNKKILKKSRVFLDSTIARFWSSDEEVLLQIKSAISKVFDNEGFFLDDYKYLKYNNTLNWKNSNGDPLYGNMFWCANPSILIQPDYFNKVNTIKAMHGYYSIDQNSYGTAIMLKKNNETRIIEEKRLIDICATLCDILDISYPKSNEGISFYL